MTSDKEKKQAEEPKRGNCSGDGVTWSDAAEKAQEELDATGEVDPREAEAMKRHASG